MKRLLILLFPLIFISACSGSKSIGGDERTISQQLKDDNLASTAIDKVVNLDFYNHRVMHVNIITNNGYMLLTGQVPDQATSDAIETELDQLIDVKALYNQLRIGRTLNPLQIAKDAWITTKVKSQFSSNEAVNAFKIKVITENGEVFLIGQVTSEMSNQATQVARKINGVKQVVRVFELID